MRWLTFLIAALSTSAAPGDILHLRDGSRYQGTLISQDERQVVFQVVLADGVSGAVRVVPAGLVKRVERTGLPPASGPGSGSKAPPVPASPPDFEQILREAYELLDDADRPAALRALEYLVETAPPDTLAGLERQARAARGLGLAELLATTRLQSALGDGRPRHFRIKSATYYEREALGRLLEERCRPLLAVRYQGRTITDWVADRTAYETLRPDTRQLVADARLAAGMIGARLRFDPRLKGDRERRLALLNLRDDLSRLVAHITALPGYTAPTGPEDVDDPAAREANRLRALLATRPAGEPRSEEAEAGQSRPSEMGETP